MIGVIPRVGEAAVVEEFFQLFKTPWELFQEGRTYDVVIATADELPAMETRLLLIFGSEIRRDDSRRNITTQTKHSGAVVRHHDARIPIYGGALTFDKSSAGTCSLETDHGAAGVTIESQTGTVLRVGYDLFQEIKWLLSSGQPVENAHIPTIELHIMMLREWMLEAGITFMEIPPVPAGKQFIVSLTHDIDFIGIRHHKFDHTMWGFLYRSTVGALRDHARGRVSFDRLVKTWRAAASLPLVFLGWLKDFWIPFDWYLQVEKNLPATYFLIPFKNRAGANVSGTHAERRATRYDVSDLGEWTKRLEHEGCELGLHGIDAWHSVELGRVESERISSVTKESAVGIRMHWLLRDENTYHVLDETGFAYDSTDGYNETIGYRAGTTQVFRPLGTRRLLELPMHIQDGALFYSNRLDLSEPEAWERCGRMIDGADKFGGVLTCLWHDRSHGPERFWGDFYARLVGKLRTMNVWFGSAGQVVDWFRKRRQVALERVKSADEEDRIKICSVDENISPPLTLRVHYPTEVNPGAAGERRGSIDISWSGQAEVELEELFRKAGLPKHPVMSK
jgi:hypothetical protein